jgi:hypothetical protein
MAFDLVGSIGSPRSFDVLEVYNRHNRRMNSLNFDPKRSIVD